MSKPGAVIPSGRACSVALITVFVTYCFHIVQFFFPTEELFSMALTVNQIDSMGK